MEMIQRALVENLRTNEQSLRALERPIAEAIQLASQCVANGGTIFWAGNGGSAADAQHMAAELVGRFKKERRAIKSIALSTNTSALTALANDYSYEEVFRRQLSALGTRGDVIFAISTSGNSGNIVAMARHAIDMGITVVGLTGKGGGKLAPFCKILLAAESSDTARIQECHLLIEHILCEGIENSIG